MKDEMINFLIHQVEGYERTNVSADRGGDTQWGITQSELKRHGKSHPISLEEAQQWFVDHYWIPQNLDEIEDNRLQWRLFCDGVHVGIHTANRFLQRILNAANRQGKRWPNIQTDGIIGQKTRSSLHQYYSHSKNEYDETLYRLCEMIKSQTFNRYLDIMMTDETQEDWFNGWVNRLTKNPSFYDFVDNSYI